MGGGGYKTGQGGGGGHVKFYHYKGGGGGVDGKDFSYAEGGHKMFWGVFYVVASS